MKYENEDIYGDGGLVKLCTPPGPNWEVCINGNWSIKYIVYLENGPNWFHRLMYRLILGLHWRKV